ncbi:MAG TPA: MarR family transcriptional regulator [Gammaproteobacteria bacterium]|nr:MarR family transcriptional regulator [Gammaproteobacteria bacterium]
MHRRDAGTSAQSDNIARIKVWRSSVQRYLHDSRGILKHHGVTTRAYHAMLEIWGAPADKGLSIGALADLIHLAHNSAVGVVDQLCKKGYAVRKRAASDKRVVQVQLTDQGRIVLAALVDDHLRELDKISSDLRRVI